MKLLLDTHVMLWSILEPERLPADVASALEDPENEIWLSPISIWEMLVLAEKHRIDIVDETPEAWVRRVLEAAPLREATVGSEIAIQSRNLALPHQDPADRFIAATALVYDLVLVTADDRLLACEQIETISCQ
jgi:PIN domain nuclease of toxin-antitoxin system